MRLCDVLWTQRGLIEDLQYRLSTQLVMLRAGQVQWSRRAIDEVRAVLASSQDFELMRVMATEAAAAALGLSVDPPLRAVAEAAPEPWSTLLHDHRKALEILVEGADELSLQVGIELGVQTGEPAVPVLFGSRERVGNA